MQELNIIKCDKLDKDNFARYVRLHEHVVAAERELLESKARLQKFKDELLIELAGEQPPNNSILPSECLRERRALKILDNEIYLVYYP